MKKSDTGIESWAYLLRVYNKVLKNIKSDLKDNNYPSLEWYDLLWCLEREGNGKLRLSELAEKVDLEKYSVTRLVDKLVEEKLVEKLACEDDKRGSYAVLTEKGKRMRLKIWNTYRKSIHKNFASHLTTEESLALIKILQKLF